MELEKPFDILVRANTVVEGLSTTFGGAKVGERA
jgi:hypothetical protein